MLNVVNPMADSCIFYIDMMNHFSIYNTCKLLLNNNKNTTSMLTGPFS